MTHRDITLDTPVGVIASSFPELLPELERLVAKCVRAHGDDEPRLTSYGINAYLTPNHPSYWGVRASKHGSRSRCRATVARTSNPMIQARQWDASVERPGSGAHPWRRTRSS